jgi:hypothetical protein
MPLAPQAIPIAGPPPSPGQQAYEFEHGVPMHPPGPASAPGDRENVRTAVPSPKAGPAGKLRTSDESLAVYVPRAPKRMPDAESPHTRVRLNELPDRVASSLYRAVGALSKYDTLAHFGPEMEIACARPSMEVPPSVPAMYTTALSSS